MSDHILHCAQCGAAIGGLSDGAPDKCPECGGTTEISVASAIPQTSNLPPLGRVLELKILSAVEIHQVACESAPCGNSIELFKLSQEALNSAYDMAYALFNKPTAPLCKCSCGDDDEHDFEDEDDLSKRGKTLLG